MQNIWKNRNSQSSVIPVGYPDATGMKMCRWLHTVDRLQWTETEQKATLTEQWKLDEWFWDWGLVYIRERQTQACLFRAENKPSLMWKSMRSQDSLGWKTIPGKFYPRLRDQYEQAWAYSLLVLNLKSVFPRMRILIRSTCIFETCSWHELSLGWLSSGGNANVPSWKPNVDTRTRRSGQTSHGWFFSSLDGRMAVGNHYNWAQAMTLIMGTLNQLLLALPK